MKKKRALPPDRAAECTAAHELFLAKKNQLKLSQKKVAEAAGITPAAVNLYFKGINPLNAKFAAVLSRLLDEPVDSFSPRLAREIGEMAQAIIEGEPVPGAANEALLHAACNEPMELPAFLRRSDRHSNVQGEPVKIRDGVVPVVGIAKLGTQGYFDALDYPVGHGDGYVLISSSDENAYALRVVGDSMEPRIRNGEFVMIEPNKPYVSGDDVLVQFTDGALVQSMIKVFMHERDGFVRLLSVNDSHAPMTIERERILKIHPVGAILKPSRYIAAG